MQATNRQTDRRRDNHTHTHVYPHRFEAWPKAEGSSCSSRSLVVPADNNFIRSEALCGHVRLIRSVVFVVLSSMLDVVVVIEGHYKQNYLSYHDYMLS